MIKLSFSVCFVNFEQVNNGLVIYASDSSNSLVLNQNIKNKTHQNFFPGIHKKSVLNQFCVWGGNEVSQKEIWMQH